MPVTHGVTGSSPVRTAEEEDVNLPLLVSILLRAKTKDGALERQSPHPGPNECRINWYAIHTFSIETKKCSRCGKEKQKAKEGA